MEENTSKKRIKALSNVAIKNNKRKENIWYLNITAVTVVHMTLNLIFYITINLNHQTAKIETTDGIILKMQSANIIYLYILVRISIFR